MILRSVKFHSSYPFPAVAENVPKFGFFLYLQKAKAEKQRKKLAELEAQLVLASPNLVFKVKGNGRAYTFFLSSEFERSQWVDAIETLKVCEKYFDGCSLTLLSSGPDS